MASLLRMSAQLSKLNSGFIQSTIRGNFLDSATSLSKFPRTFSKTCGCLTDKDKKSEDEYQYGEYS